MSSAPHRPIERCFVHNLPPELLCQVFSFLAKYRDRLSAAMVCHFWRDAMLSAPALLWSNVVSKGRKLGVLARMLARTCSAPARLTVTIRKANVTEVSSALKLHMVHLTHLSVCISEPLAAELSAELAAALATSAPILQLLVVMDVFFCIGEGFGNDISTMFSSCSPKLSCLKLYSHSVRWQTAPFWPNLQHLLFSPTLWERNDEKVANLQHYIAHAAPLKTLGLDFKGFGQGFADLRIVSHIETLVIKIGGLHNYDIAEVVAHLDCSRLRILTLLFAEGCDEDVATELMKNLCSRMGTEKLKTYSSLLSSDMILEGTSGDGRIWEMFDVSPSFTAETFAGLHFLSFSDCEWTGIAAWPTAPVLTTLEIRLISPYYAKEVGHRSLFLDVRAGGSLPHIETVCFSGAAQYFSAARESIHSAGCDVVLAPEMITDFLRFRVEYPRDRRPDIRLRRVKILEFAIDHVATLLSCIADIQVEPGRLPQDSEGELFMHWGIYPEDEEECL